MEDCDKLIKNGMILRYILTVSSFYILSLIINNKFINKYIYLIILILLTVLDGVDNFFTKINNYSFCNKTYYYQYTDKICDWVSYLITYIFLYSYLFIFKNDIILL